MEDIKHFFKSRRDSIYGVIEYLTLAKSVQIQYLNREFFYKIIPNMTKKIYWRKPSEKEVYTHPVYFKSDEFRFKYYSRFKNLVSLGLYEIEIDENFLKTFNIVVENNYQNLKELELFYLSFKNEDISNRFLQLVLRLTNLSTLEINNNLNLPLQIYFSSNLINIHSFFVNLKSLRFYYIDYSELNNVIRLCEKIDSLYLSYCKLSNMINFNNFIDFLKTSRLEKLCLQYEDMEASCVKPLITSLRHSSSLKYIVFDNCNFIGLDNPNSINIISELLSNNLNLTKISVINTKNIIYFVNYLVNPDSLETFELSSCNINDTLLECLVKILQDCKNLNTLNLSNNKISFNGIKNSFSKLSINFLSNIKEINLACNKNIENEGLRLIAESIIEVGGVSLKKLNLTNCGIDMNSCEETIMNLIIKMLYSNTPFEIVLLRNNPNKITDIIKFIEKFGNNILIRNGKKVKGNINFYAFKLDFKKLNPSTIEIINNLRMNQGIILN